MVGLLEAVTSWTDQKTTLGREMSAVVVVGSVTFCSIASVFSYNVWQDYTLFGMNFNAASEGLYDKITLPLGGLLIALFAGWFMKRDFAFSELLPTSKPLVFGSFSLKFVVVPAIAIILITGLM